MTGHAAACAVVLHRGRVILARRRKSPDAGLWGFPGGRREPGEPIARTAIRELAEETGVTAAPRALIAVLPAERFRLAMVECRHLRGAPRPADDVDAAAWAPVREVLAGAWPTSRGVGPVLALALLSPAARPPGCGTCPTWR